MTSITIVNSNPVALIYELEQAIQKGYTISTTEVPTFGMFLNEIVLNPPSPEIIKEVVAKISSGEYDARFAAVIDTVQPVKMKKALIK